MIVEFVLLVSTLAILTALMAQTASEPCEHRSTERIGVHNGRAHITITYCLDCEREVRRT